MAVSFRSDTGELTEANIIKANIMMLGPFDPSIIVLMEDERVLVEKGKLSIRYIDQNAELKTIKLITLFKRIIIFIVFVVIFIVVIFIVKKVIGVLFRRSAFGTQNLISGRVFRYSAQDAALKAPLVSEVKEVEEFFALKECDVAETIVRCASPLPIIRAEVGVPAAPGFVIHKKGVQVVVIE